MVAAVVSQSIGGVRARQGDVAEALVRLFGDLGVTHAFGVSGGGIARVWQALVEGSLTTIHCRSEAGATFAATEASLRSRRPVVVFATTGPGITSTLTGMIAARQEGAKLILVTPQTSAEQLGTWAVQETPTLVPSPEYYERGRLFDDVFQLSSGDDLAPAAGRVWDELGTPGAYLAHISIAVNVQNRAGAAVQSFGQAPVNRFRGPERGAVDQVVRRMQDAPFALWLGHGAAGAYRQVRSLVERTGAPVLSTPRGKGVVDEADPRFLGVTGLGGYHDGAAERMAAAGVEWVLVLGSRLSEASSGWDSSLVPPGGFVQVDAERVSLGLEAQTYSVTAEIGDFLRSLLVRPDLPKREFGGGGVLRTTPPPQPGRSTVRPQVLMGALQRRVLDAGIPVLVEPGSAMAWATNLLQPQLPRQVRIVGLFGSMCQMTAGVLGSAAEGAHAVCLSGDGSMLMGNELSTAAEHGLPAAWVVLNDAKYAMCEKGVGFGPDERHARFPRCDFAQIARGMGVPAEQVCCEEQLELALQRALTAEGPYLVDVIVDGSQTAPFQSRLRTLS